MVYIRGLLLTLFLGLTIISCSQGNKSSSLITKPSSTATDNEQNPAVISLTAITVYSDKVSFAVGDVASLGAIGLYSNGTSANISTDVIWSSSDSAKVSILANAATAVAAGSATVTATVDGVSSSLVLLPFSANVTAIELSSSSINLPSDGQTEITVTALYDNGQTTDVTSLSTFTTDDRAVASVSGGMVSAVAAGSTNLNIDYNGHTATAAITISSAVITSIQVSPIVGSKVKGATQQFFATATLDNGQTLDITSSASWSSSNTSVLSIASSGLANLNNSAVATVTATYAGLSSDVSFTVTNKTISSLALTLGATSISTSVTTSASVVANYSDGSSEDVTDSVTFSSSDMSVATISNAQSTMGQINPVVIGTTTISATLSGVSTAETLTVTGASLVSIAVETNNSLLSSGVNAYFRAIGSYDDASVVDITSSVTWSLSTGAHGSILNSSQDKGLFINTFSGGSTTALTITATLGATNGSLEILLAPATITSITVNPQSAIMNTAQNTDLRALAHFSDGASMDITDVVTWSSADTSIVMVSNSVVDAGRVSSLTEGSVNVSANYNGMNSSNCAITVDNGQTPAVSDNGDGLSASYFSGISFNTLKGQRIDSQVNFNWSTGQAPLGVGDSFSVRWTGKIKGKYTGDCQVSSRTDDGFRLYIGGNSIIDVWFHHATRWDHNYNVAFVEGEKQDITVEFFESGGYAVAELYWQCPGDGTLDPIPTEYLYSN